MDRRHGITERPLVRVRAGRPAADRDRLVHEEPLEIRLGSEPLAVTMRTPGDDAQLAIGFLFSEGVLRGIDDVGTIAHCGRAGEEGYGNVLEVTPAPGARLNLDRVEASRRGTLTTAACGLCGRRSVEDLLDLTGRVPAGAPLPLPALLAAPHALRERQVLFSATGAVHAAAALGPAGELVAVYEDVGRHNAVDKVIGALVQAGLVVAPARRGGPLAPAPRPAAPTALVVSGRASFEMVHKAAMAGIAIVASVSAATSLAIDLADRAGMALATFVREDACNLYGNAARIRWPATS